MTDRIGRYRTLGLSPADFGTTGLTLGMLVGIALNEPERATPRAQTYGRGGGKETMQSWRMRAVEAVLKANGVDLDSHITDDELDEEGVSPRG